MLTALRACVNESSLPLGDRLDLVDAARTSYPLVAHTICEIGLPLAEKAAVFPHYCLPVVRFFERALNSPYVQQEKRFWEQLNLRAINLVPRLADPAQAANLLAIPLQVSGLRGFPMPFWSKPENETRALAAALDAMDTATSRQQFAGAFRLLHGALRFATFLRQEDSDLPPVCVDRLVEFCRTLTPHWPAVLEPQSGETKDGHYWRVSCQEARPLGFWLCSNFAQRHAPVFTALSQLALEGLPTLARHDGQEALDLACAVLTMPNSEDPNGITRRVTQLIRASDATSDPIIAADLANLAYEQARTRMTTKGEVLLKTAIETLMDKAQEHPSPRAAAELVSNQRLYALRDAAPALLPEALSAHAKITGRCANPENWMSAPDLMARVQTAVTCADGVPDLRQNHPTVLADLLESSVAVLSTLGWRTTNPTLALSCIDPPIRRLLGNDPDPQHLESVGQALVNTADGLGVGEWPLSPKAVRLLTESVGHLSGAPLGPTEAFETTSLVISSAGPRGTRAAIFPSFTIAPRRVGQYGDDAQTTAWFNAAAAKTGLPTFAAAILQRRQAKQAAQLS